jgi:hypothetical protein
MARGTLRRRPLPSPLEGSAKVQSAPQRLLYRACAVTDLPPQPVLLAIIERLVMPCTR